MAKTESTAVNELIDLVKKRAASPVIEPGADLFGTSSPAGHPARTSGTLPGAGEVAPLPRSRAPQSTATHSMPATADRARVRMSTANPARGTTIPPLPPRAATPDPARAASPSLSRAPAGTLPPPTSPIAAPFEVTRSASSLPPLNLQKPDLVFDPDSTWVGTLPDKRTRADNVALAKMLAIPALACIAAGIGLGFYVTGNKHKAKPTAATEATKPAPTQVAPTPPPTETVLHPVARSAESANAGTASAGGAQPEPPTKAEQAAQVAAAAAMTQDAPADAVREIQTIKGIVKLTDVRIDTDPAGASVTLVDGGKQFPLGATPLVTSVDAARQYDVIVELPGRPSQMVHLDPATTSRLDISIARKTQRAALPAAGPKAAAEPKTAAEPKAIAEPKATERKAASEPKAAAEPKPAFDAKGLAEPSFSDAENGTLMVSSKPPCELIIDGEATGLRTPQKAIELAPGRHTIQFKNAEAAIDKTVTVTIKAGKPTKLIQDLMTK